MKEFDIRCEDWNTLYWLKKGKTLELTTVEGDKLTLKRISKKEVVWSPDESGWMQGQDDMVVEDCITGIQYQGSAPTNGDDKRDMQYDSRTMNFYIKDAK